MNHSYLYPPFYSFWLKERLPGAVTETQATCDSCAMVKPEGLTRDPGPFLRDLKCCTYFPFLPNFSLGKLVGNAGAQQRLRVLAAGTQGLLLPLGLFPTSERQALGEELGTESFGRRRELLCPFFDSASLGCSIWQERPAVCTTYFCKSDQGFSGLEFWQEVESYLNHFEWVLASEVYRRLGFDDDDMEICRATMMTEEPGEERTLFLQEAWKKWSGEKLELFRQASVTAEQITPDELSDLLGAEFLDLEETLRDRTQPSVETHSKT